jgi:hypothetical protein
MLMGGCESFAGAGIVLVFTATQGQLEIEHRLCRLSAMRHDI